MKQIAQNLFFTNYWVGCIGQSSFEWNCYLQHKQLQFVDSMPFVQVTWAFFSRCCQNILGAKVTQPPRKISPYMCAYDVHCVRVSFAWFTSM